METDVCRRFNPLMLNPFKLPNLLHANNDYLVLLLMEPLLLFPTSYSPYTHTQTHTHLPLPLISLGFVLGKKGEQ